MMLETDRLILRPWKESDAKNLYEYAKSPLIGPMCGWPAHISVEDSHGSIVRVLSNPEHYVVVLKAEEKLVGSISLSVGDQSSLDIPDDEDEIGYWAGEPYWGQGLIPEAVKDLLKYGFVELGLKKIWCTYFEGNIKSKRVQEKCGFIYQHTKENEPRPLMNDFVTKHVNCLTCVEWQKSKVIEDNNLRLQKL